MRNLFLLFIPLFSFAQPADYLDMPARHHCTVYLVLQAYDRTSPIEEQRFEIQNSHNEWTAEFNGGVWHLIVDVAAKKKEQYDVHCRVQLDSGASAQTAVQVRADFDGWSTANYVLLPGAVYNGNRFHSLPMKYPPLMSDPKYFHPDLPITITNVPRLNINSGPSKIEQTTGDLSTPATGFFSSKQKQAVWILTDQRTRFGNSGLTVEESADRTKCRFSITAPAMRKMRQSMAAQVPSIDRAPDWRAGDELALHARLNFDHAAGVQDLFDKLVDIRKDFTGPTTFKQQLPFRAAFDIIEKKYNAQNWDESRGYYSVGMRENMAQDWQLGWVGGLMATLPLLANGDSLSFSRAYQNIETILAKTQAPSGFFYGIGDGQNWYSDGFASPHPHNMHMVRKSADALYFLSRQLLLLEAQNPQWQCPVPWRQALSRLADAFVNLWQRYGEFGQFVDVETGDMLVWGSTAGAMAPGALALAAHYLKDDDYLKIAEQAAKFYYNRDIKHGLTTGGPGEILQSPDSESAFAMLESFVTLYQLTGKNIFKKMAQEMANQCASWVVSYDYQFPDQSLFGRLDIKSTGAVFANVQNKHAAPGICTLSGSSLLHLYRATGDTLYLDFLRDMAHNITQYLSRADRLIGDMPPGWMNERVNLSDWEGENQIGGIFRGSTWAEVACMLTATEIPSIYVQRQTWDVWTFDHITVQVIKKGRFGLELMLTNPTQFKSTYTLLIEDQKNLKKKLSPIYFNTFDTIELSPGESKKLKITYKSIKTEDEVKKLSLPAYRVQRMPKKMTGHIVPGLYVFEESVDFSFLSLDVYARTTTLYKPSQEKFRSGITWSAGINAIVVIADDEVGFATLPYFSAGPEFRVFDSFFIHPYMSSIGFPFNLYHDYWKVLTYAGLDVGVRIPQKDGSTFLIHYGIKKFADWFDAAENDKLDMITFHNLSIGFEF